MMHSLPRAFARAMQDPEIQRQFADMGFLPAKPMGVDEFWTFVQKQMPEAAETVRASGARLE